MLLQVENAHFQAQSDIHSPLGRGSAAKEAYKPSSVHALKARCAGIHLGRRLPGRLGAAYPGM